MLFNCQKHNLYAKLCFRFFQNIVMTDQIIPAGGHEKNIQAFLAKLRQRLPHWDGQTWNDWAPHEAAAAVRAISQDYLDAHGDGHDWQEAGNKAEFMLAVTFNDIVHTMFEGEPPSHNHDLHLRFNPGGQDEGFEVLLSQPTEFLLPPVPSMGGNGVVPAEPLSTSLHQAQARARASFNALDINDETILQTLDQIAVYINGKDRIALMLAAAMLTRWRGCQVSQVIQGGGVYREIYSPLHPQRPVADVRILYARVGNRINQVLSSHGPMGNVVVLL